jgi:hypothetical protein
LNQRPLGYEGNGGSDGRQALPTNAIRDPRLRAGRVGPGWGWLAEVHGQDTDSLAEVAPRGSALTARKWRDGPRDACTAAAPLSLRGLLRRLGENGSGAALPR